MIITILNVEETQKKSANGKAFQQLEIAFKDENGKIQSKKLMSFNFPEVFAALKPATPNQMFEIQSEKNDRGYWDWIKATKTDKIPAAPVDPDQPSKSSITSTYSDPRETKQEREKRQVMIIRQSCLAQAVAYGQDTIPDFSVTNLLNLAEKFEAWVMRDMKETVVTMEDDIPF